MKILSRTIIKDPRSLPSRILYLLAGIVLIAGSLIWWHPRAGATTSTFSTPGTTTWTVPAGVTSAVFEAWGGGGAGGWTNVSSSGAGGGAGGQYAKTTLTGLTPSDVYTVVVAAVATATTSTVADGNDSSVTAPSSSTVVLAKGGGGGQGCCGTLPNGGSGSNSGSVGDLINPGGNGAGGSTTVATSGGGGGAAGSTGAGGAASGNTAGTGTSLNGGNGGAGGTGNFTGAVGSNYGGGGGGGSKSNGSTKSGGNGAQGLVTVTYTANTAPAAPTLGTPSSGATGISIAPSFTLSTTDADNDYVQFRIYLYQSNCTTAIGSSPFAEASSQTGWSGQDAGPGGNTAYGTTGPTTATYTYQGTLSYNTQYCWKADAIDPGGSNSYGSVSGTRLFTTVANSAPNSPTLTAPSSGATGVSTTPTFSFSDTDSNSDDIQFKINLFQSDCSTSVTTYDMASGQTGWSPTFNGTAGSGLTYTSSTSGSGVSFAPSSALSNSTTYCWSVSAKDPGGSNTTATSGTQSFTTAASSDVVNIGGGVNITGGTNVY